MANYSTQEVVTEPVRLTEAMQKALERLRGASTYREKEANVLDGIIEGALLHTYCVTFDGGWQEDVEEDVPEDENKDEVGRLALLSKERFFHEVLKVNPSMTHIELQSGWSCDRMRTDGFGGSSLHVTRKGYLYLTTTDVVIDEDGTCRHAGKFEPWTTAE